MGVFFFKMVVFLITTISVQCLLILKNRQSTPRRLSRKEHPDKVQPTTPKKKTLLQTINNKVRSALALPPIKNIDRNRVSGEMTPHQGDPPPSKLIDINCEHGMNIHKKKDIIIKFIFYDSDPNNPRYTSPCYSFNIDVTKGTVLSPDKTASISKDITLDGTNVNLVYQIKGNKDIKLKRLIPSNPQKTHILKQRNNVPIKILDKSHNTNIDQLILQFTK